MEQKSTKELVLFTLPEGNVTINVQLNNENVWLSLNQLSTLFDRDKSVISRHLKNIYNEHELDINSTVAKIATVGQEGSREVIRDIEYYNLDVILSVGYRVNSKQATKFRQWANKVLKDYILKGYALNNNLMINNQLVTAQGQNMLAKIN